jgi:hypothetical protein
MAKFNSGQKVGEFTIIEQLLVTIVHVIYKRYRKAYRVTCDKCGAEIIIRADALISLKNKGCGDCAKALRRNKFAKTALAASLKRHKQFCYNSSDVNYPKYGAKGRTIAAELLYTKDPKANEALLERAIQVIGDKPLNAAGRYDEDYQLHVDWRIDDVMSLYNTRWVLGAINGADKTNSRRTIDDKVITLEAKRMGLNPKTVTARDRSNSYIGEIFDQRLKSNIDFKKQKTMRLAILSAFARGYLYATRDGKVYEIVNRVPRLMEGSSEGEYVRIKLSTAIRGKAERVRPVMRSHIVLLQYAGLPPERTNNRIFECDHIDEDTKNDSVTNLCWLIHSINSGQ